MKLNLGVIVDEHKQIIAHRSLVKVLLNPIFRRFGFYIGTIILDNEVIGVKFFKGQKTNDVQYNIEAGRSQGIRIRKRQII